MREVSVNRASTNLFSRYLTPQEDLRVQLGDDVELDCSTSASETPRYSWFKEVMDISGTKISVLNLTLVTRNTLAVYTVAMNELIFIRQWFCLLVINEICHLKHKT